MSPGPSRSAGQESADVTAIKPVAPGGVDLFTHPALLGPGYLRQGENIRLADGCLARRLGPAKIYKASSVGGSKTFGATTKYATIPAASQLLLPAGGHAFHASFVATRPSAGNTAWLLSSRPNGQTYHVYKVTLDENGLLTCAWRTSAAATITTTTAAITAGLTVHLWAIYDPIAGTYTAYINGTASGTPHSGLASTLQPAQDTGVIWAVGVEKETSAAVTANSQFLGAIDSLTLMTLVGTRPSSGTTTLLATLLRHSARQWPSPWMDCIRFNYDMDAASAMTDSSLFANHATLVGVPADTPAVAYDSLVSNFVGSLDMLDGSLVNIIGNHGRLFFETVRP